MQDQNNLTVRRNKRWISFALVPILCTAFSVGGALRVSAQSAPATVPVPAPVAATISQLTGGQAKILHAFNAPSGLIGIALNLGPGKDTIIYASKDGAYLIRGVIVDAKGNNLTKLAADQYLPKPPSAADHFAALGNAHDFLWGKASAKKELWVVFDANCIFCHKSFEGLKSFVADGSLKVHILPVGVVKQSSLGKAAAILAAKDPVAALKEDEAKFDVNHEEGGIASDLSNAAAVQKVKENNAWMNAQGIQGTPFMLYRDAHGQPHAIAGYVQDTAGLIAAIGSASK